MIFFGHFKIPFAFATYMDRTARDYFEYCTEALIQSSVLEDGYIGLSIQDLRNKIQLSLISCGLRCPHRQLQITSFINISHS